MQRFRRKLDRLSHSQDAIHFDLRCYLINLIVLQRAAIEMSDDNIKFRLRMRSLDSFVSRKTGYRDPAGCDAFQITRLRG